MATELHEIPNQPQSERERKNAFAKYDAMNQEELFKEPKNTLDKYFAMSQEELLKTIKEMGLTTGENWNDFISPSVISYDHGEDIAYEEFNFRLYEAAKILDEKLKEAKDTNTKQKLCKEYEEERRCAREEYHDKLTHPHKYGLC